MVSRYSGFLKSLIFIGLVATSSVLLVDDTSAQGAWGASGPTSGGSSTGYWTTNGFGWKIFDVSGGGPSGGFQITNWNAVQSSCRGVGDDKVWVHVVRNPSGGEKSFTYGGAPYNSNRPSAGSDPYIFNASGVYEYQGPAYQQKVINIVATVETYYKRANSSGSGWGSSVGWFCWSNAQPWSAGVSASVNTRTASPGDVITWTHTVRNNGPGPTRSSIIYDYINSGGLGTGNGTNRTWPTNQVNGASTTFTSTYTVRASDVNTNLCRATRANPGSNTDSNWKTSSSACVSVPFDYSLVPYITSPTNGTIEGDVGEIGVAGSIRNNGPTRTVRDISWQISRIDYGRDATITQLNLNGGPGEAPCQFFENETRCDRLDGGTVSDGFGFPSLTDYVSDTDIELLAVGVRVCFALSVQKYDEQTNDWRHSALVCLVVGKKPKIQVLGGDVWAVRDAGASVQTSTTVLSNGTRYGSWGEYAVGASGVVTGMSSGAGYRGGSTAVNFCDVSFLTISNARVTPEEPNGICTNSTIKGDYAYVSALPAVLERFNQTEALDPDAVNIDLSNLDGVYTTARTINVRATQPIGLIDDEERGRSIVINAPEQTVNITGDILYTDEALSSVEEIPQVIIIANRINIAESVTRVDAWLIASGESGVISTCGAITNPSTQLNDSRCDAQLTVNGPIAARTLLLYRTAGAGPGAASGEPAEIFNLRPDAYLWSTGYNTQTARVPTVTSQERPPRF